MSAPRVNPSEQLSAPAVRQSQPPLVSVVVPTCNRRAILEKCLSALARQTHPSYEVIVVDDCSSDDTPELLRAFAEAHPALSLRWFRNETHAGTNVSRNRGAREARGEYVAFLDSDCIARADWLERLIAGFDRDNVAAVTGLVTDPPSANIYEHALSGIARVHGRDAAPRLVGGNMAVRREALLRFPFDEDPGWKSARVGAAVASPVCDEEGLYLSLRAAGYYQHVIPDAVVLHEHRYDCASFFRHAINGGRGAAFLVHRYRLPPRLDLMPLLLLYMSLPVALVFPPTWYATGGLLAVFVVALAYNEVFRKGKSLAGAALCLPLMIVYYQFRLFAYVGETIRLIRNQRRVR